MTELRDIIAEQAERWFLWFVFGLGIGAAVYFSVPVEPTIPVLIGIAIVGCALIALARSWWVAPALMVASILFGFALGGWQAILAAEPKLTKNYSGPIAGTIYKIDQSHSGATRVWLRQIDMDWDRPEPTYIRVSLAELPYEPLKVGQRIAVQAFLTPPPRKSDPHGYDFERAAWFMGLGGVGYARDPPNIFSAAPTGWSTALPRWRALIADTLDTNMSARASALAKAILIGDRTGIAETDLEALRIANLAHLLAISGLHMGLMTAIVFFAVRTPLVFIFYHANARMLKKVAAATALAAGAFYLVISGFGVATQRAFVMVAVMLCAVLLDRPAISLRSLAVAGAILIILQPELIVHAGFQMSFAATSALIVGFDCARRFMGQIHSPFLKNAIAVVLSSGLAGFATAPIAVAHFNRIAVYGLPANLISVPLMGALILPALLIALTFEVIGLGRPFFFVAEQGLLWILNVAVVTSDQPGASIHVPSMGTIPVSVLAIGWAIVCIGTGYVRGVGVVIACVGFLLFFQSDRPAILVSDRGGTVGVQITDQRAINREKGASFEISQWLESDGLVTDQVAGFALWPKGTLVEPIPNVLVISGKDRPDRWIPCDSGTLVIAPRLYINLKGECDRITGHELSNGAVKVHIIGDRFRIETIPQTQRIWSRKPDQ
ncbi:MAG: ComEC/Rec2 family competence protein [Pseudomonadota bacterium]